MGPKTKKTNVNKANPPKTINPPPITFSKIDESYNADRAPDTFNGREELNDIKTDNKGGYLHDIPSENSTSRKVSYKSYYFLFYLSFL